MWEGACSNGKSLWLLLHIVARQSLAWQLWDGLPGRLQPINRASRGGTGGVDAVRAELATVKEDLAAVEAAISDVDDAIAGLKKEKELQAGGEVKELQAQYDALSCKLVQETSEWNVKQKALKKERVNLQQVRVERGYSLLD